jgi:hypothetical protein
MSTFTFVTICLAFGFAIYCTFLYVRDLRREKDSFLRKIGRWIKNVIDSLFGMG